MKVYILGKLFSSDETPIVLVLSDQDKSNIAGMPAGFNRYGSFNEHMSDNECQAVMDQLSSLIGKNVFTS